MALKKYDVFVIGSGVAGRTAARICKENNLKVGISEIDKLGGTCANRGCDPKKIMLQFSDLLAYTKQLKANGITSLPKVEWEQVQQLRQKLLADLPERVENQLHELDIDTFIGNTKFVNNLTVIVNDVTIEADHFVIATGLIPRPLKIEGAELLQTSNDVLNLTEIPKTAAFIGGGYVGMEFACMLAHLGTKVTLFQRSEQVLNKFDSFLVKKLVAALKKNGVTFIFNTTVNKIAEIDNQLEIYYSLNNKNLSKTFEVVVNSSGRVPALENLNLKNTSIAYGNKGVEVDKYMQSTSCESVYACGDVSSISIPLTPLSGLQGHIVGNNIVKAKSKKFNFPTIPSTVFTYPNLSSVGLSEKEALKKIETVKILKGEGSNWLNSKKQLLKVYAYKIVIDTASDTILGAHILGPNANESINIFSMAIEKKITIKEIKKLIFTYPSYTNDIKKMLSEA